MPLSRRNSGSSDTAAAKVVGEIDALLRQRDFAKAAAALDSVAAASTTLADRDKIATSDLLFTALVHHAPDSVVSKLVADFGCDVNESSRHGFNALHLAVALKASSGIVSLLLTHGADVYSKNREMWTPLELAVCTSASEEVLELLLDREAKAASQLQHHHQRGHVHDHHHAGRSLLHLASQYSAAPHVVRALLSRGHDPHLRDAFGETPLTLATSLDLIAEMKASSRQHPHPPPPPPSSSSSPTVRV